MDTRMRLRHRLGAWTSDHREEVTRTVLKFEGDRAYFLAVTRGMAFDPDLGDSLSELEIEIARDSPRWGFDLTAMLVPCCVDPIAFLPVLASGGSTMPPTRGSRIRRMIRWSLFPVGCGLVVAESFGPAAMVFLLLSVACAIDGV